MVATVGGTAYLKTFKTIISKHIAVKEDLDHCNGFEFKGHL
jgi:hypothetical protein